MVRKFHNFPKGPDRIQCHEVLALTSLSFDDKRHAVAWLLCAYTYLPKLRRKQCKTFSPRQ